MKKKSALLIFIMALLLFFACDDNTPLLGMRVNVGDEKVSSELPYVIHEVFVDSPAYNAGLRPDDVITEIDGIALAGLVNEYVYQNLVLGKKGTAVIFTVDRDGRYLTFRVVRGKR